jgi:hypothetical protein
MTDLVSRGTGSQRPGISRPAATSPARTDSLGDYSVRNTRQPGTGPHAATR